MLRRTPLESDILEYEFILGEMKHVSMWSKARKMKERFEVSGSEYMKSMLKYVTTKVGEDIVY